MSQVFSLESQKCISSKKTPIFEPVFVTTYKNNSSKYKIAEYYKILRLKSILCNSMKGILTILPRFRNISEQCLILHPKAAITVTWRREL